MTKTKSGFTIVELLIVIVVIAILAAITVVAFNGVQDRARSSAASSGASQAVKKIATWQVDNPDTAPSCSQFNTLITNTQSPPSDCSFTSGALSYQYTAGANGAYCATVTNATKSYKVSHTATTPAQGGCSGHGQGGQAAVTNLITNPSFEAISGSTVNGVQSSSRATAESSTIAAQNGSRSLAVTPTYDASTDTFVTISNPGLKANTDYTAIITYTLQSNITSAGNGPRFRFNIGGVDAQSDVGSSKNTGTHTIRWNFSVGSSNSVSFLRIMPGGKLGDPTVYFDNLMIVENNYTGSYADGNSPNWIWNGTANNSTSTGPVL
jgi:prepilin-type N-terminal cleavage/methylation domain-containing protein